jgi:hypothetical protein
MRHVLTRHEQAAAMAADGYARVSGRPGVVLLISGPGSQRGNRHCPGLSPAGAARAPGQAALADRARLPRAKQCLGLDHDEGRSYRGLHHHLTCVTVAHAFLTCCRLARAGPHDARPQTAAA